MPWFGVRSGYLFGAKADGTSIFEERVVIFEAAFYAARYAAFEHRPDPVLRLVD